MYYWLLKLVAVLVTFGLVAAACGNGDGMGTAPDQPSRSAGEGGEPAPAPQGGDDSAPAAPASEASPQQEEPMPDGCEATVAGAKVRYAVYSPNANMDPTASSGALAGGTQLVNVWDLLMVFEPETGVSNGHAAESLTPNEDFTEWTLKIRSDITYGNGDAFVAQDVVDSMLRYLDSRGDGMSNRAAGSVALIDFDNTEVPDDSTVVFRLHRGWSTFHTLLGDEPGMIVNPRVIARLLDEETANATEAASAARLVRNRLAVSPELLNAASFGPYEVAEVAPNVRTVLRARDDYWGGPVCIEELEFTFPGSSAANWEAFWAGDFNAAFLRDPRMFAEARAAGAVLSSEDQNLGGLFLFNHGVRGAEVIGADIRIRRAVHHAINREIINERAFEGTLKTTNAIAAEGTLLWSPELQQCADQSPVYDPQAARALVDEVKADTGWDGSLFLVHADTDPGPEIVQAVEEMLESAGFDVEAALGPVTTVLIPRVVVQADYEMAGWGFNADAATWVAALNDSLLSTSGLNRMAFGHPDMDAALGDLYGAATVDDQRAALAGVQCVWAEQLPAMVYSVIEEGLALAPNVKGVQRAGTAIFLFGNAYISHPQAPTAGQALP